MAEEFCFLDFFALLLTLSVVYLALLLLSTSSTLTDTAMPNCGTLTIAHRGNAITAPENTVPAIAATDGLAHFVEFDVRQCATGELVIMHDISVNRTTDGTGAVADLTLDQLKMLDAGSWFSVEFAGETIPTLSEALAAVPAGVVPLIHSYSGPASDYITILNGLGLESEVFIQSFDWSFLEDIHNLSAGIRLAGLGTGPLTITKLDDLRDIGADIAAWRASDLSGASIQLAHEGTLQIFVWTVNQPDIIQGLLDLDVDGIITNDPATVFEMSETWVASGDFDLDTDVDLDDYRILIGCFEGPDHSPVQTGCKVFDFDCDGDLDLHDFARVANAFGS